jgi:hypothetical protein
MRFCPMRTILSLSVVLLSTASAAQQTPQTEAGDLRAEADRLVDVLELREGMTAADIGAARGRDGAEGQNRR